MTFSYDITTIVGKIRLVIGDTTTPGVFSDEELTYFLTVNANDINLAAADVLEAWIAKYTTNPDSEKIGDYSYTQNIVAHMNKLAKELRAKAEDAPCQTWAEMDLTYGSGITEESD